jgi:hypothetical protein
VAIALPSDIIMDVVRAADPSAAAAAREALAAHRAGVAAGQAGGFSAALPGLRSAPIGDASATPDSFKHFEAMVLQNFIQTMLPKDTESVYGKGMAGDMWKSMMAEQLAASMAERGGIGIASRLLRDHYVEGENGIPADPVSGPQAGADLDGQQLLSTALIEEMQRRIARTLGEGSAALDVDAVDG